MLEIRKNNDNSITVEGYVNAICRDSRVLHDSLHGDFVEQVMPSVWQRALTKADDVKMLFNHNYERCLGSIKGGNLTLSEDAIGLKIRAIINDEEVKAQAEAGKITGWSFGFNANNDSWEKVNDGLSRRYLKDINLYEVSLLDCTPAYSGTTAELRSENNNIIELRFAEDTNTNKLKDDEIKEETEDDEIKEETEDDEIKEETEDNKEQIKNEKEKIKEARARFSCYVASL